jgi:hypothetical protein
VQYEDTDFEGGANKVSLNQARKNFSKFGASDVRFKDMVRPPNNEERP